MVLYNFIKYLILSIKYMRLLKKVYNNENILYGLRQITNINFKMDNISRIYGVVNPRLIDINDQVFEYNQVGLDNSIFIERWLSSKLIIISKFIKTNNLFDLLIYDNKKLDEYDNYLIVIKPIIYEEFKKWAKRFFIIYGFALLIFILYLCWFNF